MKFEDSGFLSNQAKKISEDLYKENSKYFELFEDINKKLNFFLHDTEFKNLKNEQLVALLYFIRVLQSGQSSYLLIKSGLEDEAAIVLRSVFESYIKLLNINEDPDFVNRLIQNDNYFTLQDAKTMRKYFVKGGSKKAKRLNAIIRELRSHNYTEKEMYVSVAEMCKKVKQEPLYRTLYSHTSTIAHGSLKTLDKYVTIENGSLKSIIFGPTSSQIRSNIVALVEMFIVALEVLENFLEMDASEDWIEYHRHFKNKVM